MRAASHDIRLLACIAIVLAVSHAASAQVVVTDLGLIGPGVRSSGRAINEGGQVVGSSTVVGVGNRAALWNNGAGVELAVDCSSCTAIALDINDQGVVVGTINMGTGQSRAVVWTNGVMTELPPLPGHIRTAANAINNFGVVVGNSAGPTGNFRPVRWVNGIAEDLGVLGTPPVGLTTGDALDINDAGDIVGQSSISGLNNALHPFLWHDGQLTDLGVLDPNPHGPPGPTCGVRGVANGINELGRVVGFAFLNCETRPVIWIDGQIHELPTLTTGPSFGIARSINENGDIVGVSNTMPVPRAVLWRDGEVEDLGSLLVPSGTSNAFAINDSGLIAGFTDTATGTHAATFFSPLSNTPPALHLPADVTVNADSPAGAVVFFAATADDAEDGTFNAVCAPPSGSLFAIGSTTVSCTATDTGGLEATGSFAIVVTGAADQIQALIAAVGSSGPGKSLQNKLSAIAASLASGDGQACAKLQAFINEVSAQAGKKLTAAQAESFVAAAQRIRAVIGCN